MASLEEKVLLDIVTFDNRLKELELKQRWLAEQIGVDRKTVGRWLIGQTKKIRRDNLKKLAEILKTAEDDLILKDEASQFASPAEQKAAALLIDQENLLEILTPSGKWPLLEGLIKASMEPNLPQSLLGQLYNFLCIAAWRQSDLNKAEVYLKKALTIAKKTGHKSVLARAKLNEANIDSFRGRIKKSLKGYLYCIENKKYFDEPGVEAAARSNIGCVYQEYGDFEKSIDFQQQAIMAYEKLKKPLNLSIAWIGLCDVLCEQGNLDAAWSACEKSLNFAIKSQLQRGIADANLFFSLICSFNDQAKDAMEYWDEAFHQFKRLGIEEGRTFRVGALAMAGTDKQKTALKFIAAGLQKSEDFPIEHSQLLLTRYSIKKNKRDLEKAIAILKKSGADARLARLRKSIKKQLKSPYY